MSSFATAALFCTLAASPFCAAFRISVTHFSRLPLAVAACRVFQESEEIRRFRLIGAARGGRLIDRVDAAALVAFVRDDLIPELGPRRLGRTTEKRDVHLQDVGVHIRRLFKNPVS